MKAVVINQYGGRDQLQEKEVSVPKLNNKDVLIEVHASAVNPVDIYIREGYFQENIPHQFPVTLGLDVAGVVKEVGASVSKFKVGDEVFSRPDIARNGTYAEYVAVDENFVAKKPANLSFEEAASIPLVGITTYQSFIDKAQLKQGDKVLIHAGAGGVGTFAIQFAKSKGAYVATTTSEKNVQFVKQLGADEVINYKTTDFSEVLSEYDIVLDTLGGDIQEKSIKVLKDGGTLVALNQQPAENLGKEKNIKASFIFMQPDGEQLQEIAELIEANKIKPIIAEQFSLSEQGIRNAHELSESKRAKGKIVIKVK
ncbi:NADP-dependent oxidoreductase [Chengkuizengella marina]|uniref:NADP-dependent oxidoreductase n=1 Tax=Chengkuizengella marina TaxID=2507566 RepID=A0A6N9Q3B5_9BACL|nr:NADP-dependent oxidoreductase [Chengkuizengella marina]NBI29288.1 NADP-dependent oxidoreductase [Chengkuizengella marina]